MPKDRYESPLASRYASDFMLCLFSPDTRFQTWRRLWVALARAEHNLGLPVTAEQVAESRLRAIRTYRHLSETAALPHGLPDAVRDYYRQALASGSHIALLALAGERLAATGGLDLRREMPSYHNPAGLSGHIMNIWTDPAFRGRGIAWRMLDLLTAAACERGCLTVSLHTTAMGRPLYQRYGFTATDDEMELELPAEKSEP